MLLERLARPLPELLDAIDVAAGRAHGGRSAEAVLRSLGRDIEADALGRADERVAWAIATELAELRRLS